MEWLFGAQEGTSTGTSGEAEEAEKKRLKVERQAERRREQAAAKLAGTEWVSKRQPSSRKAVRNKQRREEQAAAANCGLEWVPQKNNLVSAPCILIDCVQSIDWCINTWSRPDI